MVHINNPNLVYPKRLCKAGYTSQIGNSTSFNLTEDAAQLTSSPGRAPLALSTGTSGIDLSIKIIRDSNALDFPNGFSGNDIKLGNSRLKIVEARKFRRTFDGRHFPDIVNKYGFTENRDYTVVSAVYDRLNVVIKNLPHLDKKNGKHISISAYDLLNFLKEEDALNPNPLVHRNYMVKYINHRPYVLVDTIQKIMSKTNPSVVEKTNRAVILHYISQSTSTADTNKDTLLLSFGLSHYHSGSIADGLFYGMYARPNIAMALLGDTRNLIQKYRALYPNTLSNNETIDYLASFGHYSNQAYANAPENSSVLDGLLATFGFKLSDILVGEVGIPASDLSLISRYNNIAKVPGNNSSRLFYENYVQHGYLTRYTPAGFGIVSDGGFNYYPSITSLQVRADSGKNVYFNREIQLQAGKKYIVKVDIESIKNGSVPSGCNWYLRRFIPGTQQVAFANGSDINNNTKTFIATTSHGELFGAKLHFEVWGGRCDIKSIVIKPVDY